MKIFNVQVSYPNAEDAERFPNPPRYSGIVGRSNHDAYAKAVALHRNEFPERYVVTTDFEIVDVKIVLCPTALPEAA